MNNDDEMNHNIDSCILTNNSWIDSTNDDAFSRTALSCSPSENPVITTRKAAVSATATTSSLSYPEANSNRRNARNHDFDNNVNTTTRNNNNNNATVISSSEWDTMERYNQYSNEMYLYQTVRQKQRYHPGRICLVRCGMYGIVWLMDILPTIFYFTYCLVLTMLNQTSANNTTNHTNQNHILMVVFCLFLWWLSRCICVIIGLRPPRRVQLAVRSARNANDNEIMNDDTNNDCNHYCYCTNKRYLLLFTITIHTILSILFYLFIGIIYTAIQYHCFTQLPSNYIIHYVIRHSKQLGIPKTILQHYIIPCSESTKSTIPYVWFVLLFFIVMELLRSQLLSSYRSFLLFYDDHYYHHGNRHNNNGNFATNRNSTNNSPTANNNMLWENLQEPFLDITEQRYGIPAWVESQQPCRNSNASHTMNDPLDGESLTQQDNNYAINETNRNTTGGRRRRKMKRSSLFPPLLSSLWGHDDNGDDDVDNDGSSASSEVVFASIQEEWASLSEEDPFWWSRDNNTTTSNRRQQQQPPQQRPGDGRTTQW